ncbi:RidA family protein [Candidatus Nitrospira salsa]
MTIEEKLQELGIVLPSAPKPLASYVPACLAGDLLFVSGVLPFHDGKLTITGKLGQELNTEQGSKASQTAVLNALAIIQQELGTLDRVKQIVRMTGHVASATGFSEQPAVINGASDFLVKVFGESGRHARLAVGAAELPLCAPVELELIVQVII